MDIKSQSFGGQATAIILRKQALDRYYANPNICKNCGNIIEVKEKQKVSKMRLKKYCDRKCAAEFNNSLRRKDSLEKYDQNPNKCLYCNKKFEVKENWFAKRAFNKKFCDNICSAKYNFAEDNLGNRTKEDLFNSRNGYQSARTSIRKHAYKIYRLKNKPKKCEVCGYVKHIEVCHKKPVSEFSGDSLIKEINHIDNLIGLCPNCHWEFDNGYLIIDLGLKI